MIAEHGERLSVLVLAEACNPNWTSVPLVGYNVARALAERRDLDVTVATHIRNREALSGDPLSRAADVRYIDNERLARPLHRLSCWIRGGQNAAWTVETALAWPSYVAFENLVRSHFREEFRSRRWDLLHRVTPVSPVLAGPLTARAELPVVLGPLNGGLPWPAEFQQLRRREGEWLARFRRAARHLPYHRSTLKNAAAVIAGSRHTAAELLPRTGGRLFHLAENGVDPLRFPLAGDWPEPAGRFQFVTVGRLAPVKGIDMILEAMAESAVLRGCRLRIVGDGPERGRLEKIVVDCQLGHCVEFAGWLSQAELGNEYRRSQALVFASIKDFGGGVVLEAMSSALPAIVVDYGGPAELITDDCGLRLPLCRREQLVPRIRAAMESLAGNGERCRTMGRAAVERVRGEFTWSKKAERLVEIYRTVLESSTSGRTGGDRPQVKQAG